MVELKKTHLKEKSTKLKLEMAKFDAMENRCCRRPTNRSH